MLTRKLIEEQQNSTNTRKETMLYWVECQINTYGKEKIKSNKCNEDMRILSFSVQ